MKYEYRTVTMSSKEVEDSATFTKELNRLGEEGWDLATAFQQQSLGSTPYSLVGITHKTVLVFKKKLSEN